MRTIPEGEDLPQLRFITNSELKTFKECKRKWWLNYYRKLRPKKAVIGGAAPAGTRIHDAVEQWYDPTKNVDPIAFIETRAKEDREKFYGSGLYNESELKQFEEDVKHAIIVVEDYINWVEETAVDANLENFEPEARVYVPLPKAENIFLLAKLDVRATRISDGARLSIDHKSSKGSFAQKIKNLHIDEQMLHYHLVEYLSLKEEGLEQFVPTGVLYNMMKVNKRTATAKPPFFERFEVQHNLAMLKSYYKRLLSTVEDIEKTRKMLDEGCDPLRIVYPTPSESCSWKCKEFFNICSMFDDGSHIEELIHDKYVSINPLERYSK